MRITEVRKEEDYYFSGLFWLVCGSIRDMLKGNFKICSDKYLCSYNGESLPIPAHKKLWGKVRLEIDSDKDFNYYPRGRVSIYHWRKRQGKSRNHWRRRI